MSRKLSMRPLLFASLCGALALAGFARAQQPDPNEEKGTYLGVLFSPVPEVLYDQVPELPRGQGVVVTHILPDSPAAQAKLLRHDVILQYDDVKVRDCEQFARLIHADKAERKVKLIILRAGKTTTVECTLTTGPVLRIGKAAPSDDSRDKTDTPARATVKPNGPASVNVTALPMGDGKIKITFEFYNEGRLQTVACSGAPDEVETKVKELPERVQALAKVALERLRALDLQKSQEPTAPAPPKR